MNGEDDQATCSHRISAIASIFRVCFQWRAGDLLRCSYASVGRCACRLGFFLGGAARIFTCDGVRPSSSLAKFWPQTRQGTLMSSKPLDRQILGDNLSRMMMMGTVGNRAEGNETKGEHGGKEHG
jgi:hypothetical protein